MSGGYQQYAGNPYGGSGGYGASNPYGQDNSASYGSAGGYGQQNPYGSATERPQAQTQPSQMSETSHYDSNQATPAATMPPNGAGPQSPATILSNHDFLARAESIRSDMRTLTANVSEIGSIHQRLLNSPESSSSSQLENITSQTQILNTRIKDQIKYLEADAAREKGNTTKDSQLRTLHKSFKSQLEDYQKSETNYRQRYREQIQRQYKIVNPEASDAEVREAADADWGNEGVFQTALKSNRTGAANSVLGSVRARHNDIQNIEKTLVELNQLFQDLAEQVDIQEEPVKNTEQATANVNNDVERANDKLDSGIKHARMARKLKWWLFGIIVAIIVILGLVLGLYFGLKSNNNN